MTFDEATIMAYVDGECDAVTTKRIEKAIISDPELSERIDRERALRIRLTTHYDPVAEEPLPDRLTALLTAAAESSVDNSFTARKAGWDAGKRRRPDIGVAQWGAMAATLALGFVVGQFGLGTTSDSPFMAEGGALVASGPLENALETQLASAQSDSSDYRIGLTFRAKTGSICRSFTGEAVSGIGCRQGKQWKMVSTLPGGSAADYRQASSSAINAQAAEMMAKGPVDAETERKLLQSGWR